MKLGKNYSIKISMPNKYPQPKSDSYKKSRAPSRGVAKFLRDCGISTNIQVYEQNRKKLITLTPTGILFLFSEENFYLKEKT